MVAREDLSKEVTFHLRPCIPRNSQCEEQERCSKRRTMRAKAQRKKVSKLRACLAGA